MATEVHLSNGVTYKRFLAVQWNTHTAVTQGSILSNQDDLTLYSPPGGDEV